MSAASTSYHTLRLETRAMGCAWEVVLNPGAADEVMHASSALNVVHPLEQKMSVFRADSDLMKINATAGESPQPLSDDLLDVLRLALTLARETGGAFDPTSRPLSLLWRRCRAEQRIPTADEITHILRYTGFDKVHIDEAGRTIAFTAPRGDGDDAHDSTASHPHIGVAARTERHSVEQSEAGVELDLNGIGKGYGIDRAAAVLKQQGALNYLIHGGFSSIYAAGAHCDQSGWPVGLKNPLLERSDFATVFLRDQGLSTSGTNVQFFRHGGKRYGHILDPRTGWPAEELLSATVLAPTAAEADALSTALYVMGLEGGLAWCRSHPEVGAILVPVPTASRLLRPAVIGIPREQLSFQGSDVAPDWHPQLQ